MKNRPFSLRKSRNILKWVYSWYKKKGYQLSPPQLAAMESEMSSLDKALLSQDRAEANHLARRLETFAGTHCKKSIWEYTYELIIALAFALIIATLVRQMWFELYEIPTGSMRPTFREQDHLTVTKTAFGINFPLKTEHFYFDPDLVQRTSVLIFSGDNLPLRETDSTYFGVFPYKKRYIKRAIGKPGDTLYFYGGQIYGLDKNENELADFRSAPWMANLEHIPFLTYEGEVTAGSKHSIFFNQMHHPIGKVTMSPTGLLQGEIYNGQEWIKDQPTALLKPHNAIQTYGDFFGIKNYAIARLLTKEQALALGENLEGVEDGVLYLQLSHTPSLNYSDKFQKEARGVSVSIPTLTTLIPLRQQHLDALMNHMYTARFVVKEGKAQRYSLDGVYFGPNNPSFSGVPDGTYEFYYGKASKIGFGGMELAIAENNPLLSHDPENVQKLFNMGIEFNTHFSPSTSNRSSFPHRYAYFRDGNLYLLGAPILLKEDPILIGFLKREKKREEEGKGKTPYIAFKDYGAPIKDGKLDKAFIKTFGLKVPEKNYFVLGDNHAMSADSRVFGFVPQENIQGAPSLIIWPVGERFGAPQQKPYPFFNFPRLIIWTIALLIFAIWYAYTRWKSKQPIYRKINFPQRV